MAETTSGRVASPPDWSGSAPSPKVSALTGDHSSRGVEPIHLVTQRGQSYGSVRRCCERCGQMCWPGMKGSAARWTDDPETFAAAYDRCTRPSDPA